MSLLWDETFYVLNNLETIFRTETSLDVYCPCCSETDQQWTVRGVKLQKHDTVDIGCFQIWTSASLFGFQLAVVCLGWTTDERTPLVEILPPRCNVRREASPASLYICLCSLWWLIQICLFCPLGVEQPHPTWFKRPRALGSLPCPQQQMSTESASVLVLVFGNSWLKWIYLILFVLSTLFVPMCACWVTSVVSNSFMTPWAVARQAPLSMGFSRQKYWNGLPRPPPGDLPDLRIKPMSLMSPPYHLAKLHKSIDFKLLI